jgi:hypothetical protein
MAVGIQRNRAHEVDVVTDHGLAGDLAAHAGSLGDIGRQRHAAFV